MARITSFGRTGAVLVLLALASGPALAEPVTPWLGDAAVLEQHPESAWQDVITGQIEAFRAADGAGALQYAGASFQVFLSNPDEFLAAIIASGYAAIVLSQSHSFGAFHRIDELHVLQEVRILGPDRQRFEAIYELQQEEGSWRVAGVALRPAPGIEA